VTREGKLTSLQLYSLVVSSAAATGIFTIARTVGEEAGRSAILAVPLAGVLVFLQFLGMYGLARRFRKRTLPEYASDILGRPLAKAYLLGYVVVAMGLAIVVPRNYWIMLTAWVFQRTPQAAFMIPLALVCWNIARRGVVVLGRVTELVFLLGVPVILLMLSGINLVEPILLRPVVDRGISGLLQGVVPAYFSFTGFDIFLIVFPFSRQEKAVRVTAYAIGTLTLFYTMLTIAVIGSMGLELAIVDTWPLQHYLNNFTRMVVERLDVIVLIVWFFQVLLTVVIALFIACVCLRGLFPRLTSGSAANITASLLGISLLMPIYFPTQAILQELFSYASMLYAGFLPALLWLIAVLRRKGDKESNG
jgi:spore germination protein